MSRLKDEDVIRKIRLACIALFALFVILSIRNIPGDFRSLFKADSAAFTAVTAPSAILVLYALAIVLKNVRSIKDTEFTDTLAKLLRAGIILYPAACFVLFTISAVTGDDTSFFGWIALTFGSMIMHLSSYLIVMTAVSAAGALARIIFHKNAILIDPETVGFDSATTKPDRVEEIFGSRLFPEEFAIGEEPENMIDSLGRPGHEDVIETLTGKAAATEAAAFDAAADETGSDDDDGESAEMAPFFSAPGDL